MMYLNKKIVFSQCKDNINCRTVERIRLHDKYFRKMIPQEDILRAVDAVAEVMNRDHAVSGCRNSGLAAGQADVRRACGKEVPCRIPLLLCVLNGSFMFASELVRRLDFQCEISFVKLSSYSGTESTGKVDEIIGLKNDVKGREVIIVEDIVETGATVLRMHSILKDAGAEDIRVCTMFYKPEAYRGDIPVDYHAMKLENDFIVGFGLDYNELGRQYRDIYVLDGDAGE